jgi:hypothetical protein
MTASADVWQGAARARVRQVQDGLLSASEWAKASNLDEASTDLLLAPYRDLVESLYETDFPVARLVDRSDLLLHVTGTYASGPSPRVSVLAHVLTRTRDIVTGLAKQLAGDIDGRVRPRLDMALTGVAGGSLFVGFSADPGGTGDLTRNAITAIGEASLLVAEKRPIRDLASTIDDPAYRDMALAGVRYLSPSGRLGISEIEVLGRSVHGQISLTTETRRNARGILAQRLSSDEPITFRGTVRELDLDASRFEIRNVEGHPGVVRCAHELDETEAESLMNKRIRVTGTPEYGTKRIVRLLWVDEIEVLD